MPFDRQDIELARVARVGWEKGLNLQPGERALVVTDSGMSTRIADALVREAHTLGAQVTLCLYPMRQGKNAEPPDSVAAAMAHSDAFIAATARSITYTRARVNACKAGARGLTWPTLTEDAALRLVLADYDDLQRRCVALAERLDLGSRVHITSPGGTDLTASIDGRRASRIDGVCKGPGQYNQVPGVCTVALVEGSAHGRLVFNHSLTFGEPPENLLVEPVTWVIERGRVVTMQGGRQAAEALSRLESFGDPGMYELSILGLGFHPGAKLTGSFMEDERVAGVIHLGLGTNFYHGGGVVAKGRFDGCLTDGTIAIDGEVIIQDGRLVV